LLLLVLRIELENMLDDKNDNLRIIDLLKSSNYEDVNQAFILLYKKFFQMVYSLVRLNSGSRIHAEDVFQETLVVIYENIRKGNFREESRLSTYLYSISRNIWYKEFSRIYRQLKFSDSYDFDDRVEECWSEDSTKSKLIEELFKMTTKKCAELLKFFYFEKLSNEEIMKRFGQSSVSSIKSQKYRCLQQLMTNLENNPELKNELKECLS